MKQHQIKLLFRHTYVDAAKMAQIIQRVSPRIWSHAKTNEDLFAVSRHFVLKNLLELHKMEIVSIQLGLHAS